MVLIPQNCSGGMREAALAQLYWEQQDCILYERPVAGLAE